MAGISIDQEAVSEIEKLKLVAPCKIIRNIGDFAFLITATIPNTDIQIKFQLTAEYPKVVPTVFIRHPTLGKDRVQKIMSFLPEGATSLVLLYETIRELMGDDLSGGQKMVARSPQNSPSQNKKKYGDGSEEIKGQTKKPSMRTAADVIKRIQWDSSLVTEKFIVGYVDRFLGVQEQPFNAFNWVNPAEADWMDLNIPEHRIEYFKYGDTIVWEKKSRLDNVFGSTGGMTIDQLLSGGEPVGADMTEDRLSPPEDPDTNPNPCAKSLGDAQPRNIRSKPQKFSDSEQKKERPNYFIAVPIMDSAVVEFIHGLQEEYLTLSEGEGEQHMTELHNLHITLCAIRADTPDQLDTVSQCLYELILELNSSNSSNSSQALQQFSISCSLQSFFNRVLYSRAVFSEEFHNLVLKLRKMLIEKKIHIFDDENEFVPHLTVLKFPKRCGEPLLSVDNYIAIRSQNPMSRGELSVPLEQITLLSMDRDDCNKYIQQVVMEV